LLARLELSVNLCMVEEVSFHVRRCHKRLAPNVRSEKLQPPVAGGGTLTGSTFHTIIGLSARTRYSNQGVSGLLATI